MTFRVLWIFCQMFSQVWRKPLPPTSACCEAVRTAVGSVKSPYAFRRLHGLTFHKTVTLRTSSFSRLIRSAIFFNSSWAIFTEKHMSTDSHLLRINHGLLARVVHFSRSSQRFVNEIFAIEELLGLALRSQRAGRRHSEDRTFLFPECPAVPLTPEGRNCISLIWRPISYCAVKSLFFGYKNRKLMLFREITALFFLRSTQNIQMHCEHNAEFLNVKLVVHKVNLRLSSQTVTPVCRLHSATHLQAELSAASSQQRP
jgi:hypothetical protein